MKTSVKLLSLAIITTLGIGGVAKMVSAQPPAAVGAAAHSTSQAPKEASDGDGETNDGAQDQQNVSARPPATVGAAAHSTSQAPKEASASNSETHDLPGTTEAEDGDSETK